MRMEILIGGRSLHYELSRKRMKNLRLKIRPDGEIHVSAPERTPLSFIESFIRSREAFIFSALARQEELRRRAPVPTEYRSGERVMVLGRVLELRLEQGAKNLVLLSEGQLLLTVRDKEDRELKKRVLESWKRELLARKAEDACRKLYPAFEERGIAFPRIRLRKMRRRWGSCRAAAGELCFNTALAGTPEACIELVAAHELCHLIRQDHSPEFYRLLSACMPDWQKRKKLLDEHSPLLK